MGTITDTIKYSLEQSRQELDMFMSDPGTLPAMEAMALMHDLAGTIRFLLRISYEKKDFVI